MPRKKKDSEKVVEFPRSTTPISIDIPKVPVELVETSAVEEMSLEEINRRKAELRAKREQVMMIVDSEKMKQAPRLSKLISATIEKMTAMLFSEDFDPKAYKEVSDACEKLSRILPNLSRLDTNCNGEFTEIHLTIERR